jgi:hypothetical protein
MRPGMNPEIFSHCFGVMDEKNATLPTVAKKCHEQSVARILFSGRSQLIRACFQGIQRALKSDRYASCVLPDGP